MLTSPRNIVTLTGNTPPLLKPMTMAAWSATATFESMVPKVAVMTSTGMCGLNGKGVVGVILEGLPAHLTDPNQIGGRIRFMDEDYPYQFMIVASVGTWMALVLRYMTSRGEVKETEAQKKRRLQQRERDDAAMLKVLKMVVLPMTCVHLAYEVLLSNPDGNQETASLGSCGDKCYFCNPSNTLAETLADKAGTIAILTAAFTENGWILALDAVEKLVEGRARVWPTFTAKNAIDSKHGHRLTLQLVAAGILRYRVREGAAGTNASNSVEVNFHFDAASASFAYEDEGKWVGISSRPPPPPPPLPPPPIPASAPRVTSPAALQWGTIWRV